MKKDGTFVVILGIDPGYAIVGYGAICFEKNKFYDIGHGAIVTNSDMEFSKRLEYIYDNMMLMIKKCKPDAMAIEKLFFQNNQKTAIKVAQARGVIMLAASKSNIPLYEYTPLQVKMAVTGYGKAGKHQVMDMTKRLLKLDEMPKLDDTADALAIAICHIHAAGSKLRLDMINRKKDSIVL